MSLRSGPATSRRTGRSLSRARRTPLLFLLLAACAGGVPEDGDRAGVDPASEIDAMLDAHAAYWNAGDLDGFLDAFMDSTVLVGGVGVMRGVAAARARYLQGSWRGGAPASALRFEDVEVYPLGGRPALVLGRYILSDRETGATVGMGHFTVALARTEQGWRIFHDHTTASQ